MDVQSLKLVRKPGGYSEQNGWMSGISHTAPKLQLRPTSILIPTKRCSSSHVTAQLDTTAKGLIKKDGIINIRPLR